MNKYRGYEITNIGDDWYYNHNNKLVSDDIDIKCGHCDKENTTEGHDGCLGTLQGIMNACCGHGEDSACYLQFEDGSTINGLEAVKKLNELL